MPPRAQSFAQFFADFARTHAREYPNANALVNAAVATFGGYVGGYVTLEEGADAEALAEAQYYREERNAPPSQSFEDFFQDFVRQYGPDYSNARQLIGAGVGRYGASLRVNQLDWADGIATAYYASRQEQKRQADEKRPRPPRADRKRPELAQRRRQVQTARVIAMDRARVEEKKETKLDLKEVQDKTKETLVAWIRIHERLSSDQKRQPYRIERRQFSDNIGPKVLDKVQTALEMGRKWESEDIVIGQWFGIQKRAFIPRDQLTIVKWWAGHMKTPLGRMYLRAWCQILLGYTSKFGLSAHPIYVDILAQIIWKSPVQGPKIEAAILAKMEEAMKTWDQTDQLLASKLDSERFVKNSFSLTGELIGHLGPLQSGLSQIYPLPENKEEWNELQSLIAQQANIQVYYENVVDIRVVHTALIQFQDARPVIAFISDLLQSIPFRMVETKDVLPWPRLLDLQTNILKQDLWTVDGRVRELLPEWMQVWANTMPNTNTQSYVWKMFMSTEPHERYVKRLWLRANDSKEQAMALQQLIRQEAGELKQEQTLEALVPAILVPESKDPNGRRWIAATLTALRELKEQKSAIDKSVMINTNLFLQSQFLSPTNGIRAREDELFAITWNTVLKELDAQTLERVRNAIGHTISDFYAPDALDQLAPLMIQGLMPMLYLAQSNKQEDYLPFIPSGDGSIAKWLQDTFDESDTGYDMKGLRQTTKRTRDELKRLNPKARNDVAVAMIKMIETWGRTTQAPSRAFAAYRHSLSSNDPAWFALLGRPRNINFDWDIDRQAIDFSQDTKTFVTAWMGTGERRRANILELKIPPFSITELISMAFNRYAINRQVFLNRNEWKYDVQELWQAASPPVWSTVEATLKREGLIGELNEGTRAGMIRSFQELQMERRTLEQKRVALVQTQMNAKKAEGGDVKNLTEEEAKTCDRVLDQCHRLLLDDDRAIPKDCQGYCQRNLSRWLPQWLTDRAPVRFNLVAMVEGKDGPSVYVPIQKRVLNVSTAFMQGDVLTGRTQQFHIESITTQGGWNMKSATGLAREQKDRLAMDDEELANFLSATLFPTLPADHIILMEFTYRWKDSLRSLPMSFLDATKLNDALHMKAANNWPGRDQSVSIYDNIVQIRSLNRKNEKTESIAETNATSGLLVLSDRKGRWEPVVEASESYQFLLKSQNLPPVLPSYDATVCQNDVDVTTQRPPDEYLTSDAITFRIFVGGSKYEALPSKPVIYCMSASALADYWKEEAKSERPEGRYIWGYCDTHEYPHYYEIEGSDEFETKLEQGTDKARNECVAFYNLPTHAGTFHVTNQGRKLILNSLSRWGGGLVFDLVPMTQIVQGRKNPDRHHESEAPNQWVTIYDVQLSR